MSHPCEAKSFWTLTKVFSLLSYLGSANTTVSVLFSLINLSYPLIILLIEKYGFSLLSWISKIASLSSMLDKSPNILSSKFK